MKHQATIRNLLAAGAVTFGLVSAAQGSAGCPADVTNDRNVDVQDVSMVLKYWGHTCYKAEEYPAVLELSVSQYIKRPRPKGEVIFSPADCNRDGIVDVIDLMEVIQAWGGC